MLFINLRDWRNGGVRFRNVVLSCGELYLNCYIISEELINWVYFFCFSDVWFNCYGCVRMFIDLSDYLGWYMSIWLCGSVKRNVSGLIVLLIDRYVSLFNGVFV